RLASFQRVVHHYASSDDRHARPAPQNLDTSYLQAGARSTNLSHAAPTESSIEGPGSPPRLFYQDTCRRSVTGYDDSQVRDCPHCRHVFHCLVGGTVGAHANAAMGGDYLDV